MLMPGFERNEITRIRFAAQTGKCRARIGECIHANAKPRDGIAAEDADDAENQNDSDSEDFEMLQEAKIKNDGSPDKDLQNHQKPALRQKVGLAGLVNQLRDLQHRASEPAGF